jgi:hypothetical protein
VKSISEEIKYLCHMSFLYADTVKSFQEAEMVTRLICKTRYRCSTSAVSTMALCTLQGVMCGQIGIPLRATVTKLVSSSCVIGPHSLWL